MESITERVDKLFTKWAKASSPGCALAIMQDGKVVYKQGYGMANLEYDIPITPSSVFHVASVSKQFCAMAIALLANEGKLSLDDDVRQYVSELPDFGDTITIRHLIHHTSGLRDQWELLILAGWRMDDVITTEDVLELLAGQQELNFRPGAEHCYCNTGYTLLAVIVERVTGKSLREFCGERFFRPLGMHNTHFHDDHEMIVKNRAYSYAPRDQNGYKHSVLSFATVGATSLFTTVEDLALWDQNFYDGTVGGQDVIEWMHEQGVLNDGEQIDYAFGLSITDHRGLKVVQHSGGDAGYRSHLMRFPEQHFSVAILCNLGTMNPGRLCEQVANIYLADVFSEEAVSKDQAQPIELAADQLTRIAGLYYSTVTAVTRRLEMRDGKLVVVTGPGYPLEPLSEDDFRLAAFPHVKLRFEGNAADGTLRMYETMGKARPTVYEMVEPVTPTVEELATYAGTYFSSEVDVIYTVGLEENQLVLRRRKYGTRQLLPTFTDGFIGQEIPHTRNSGYVGIVFDRRGDSVLGFRLSTGRVRNLRFVRQGS